MPATEALSPTPAMSEPIDPIRPYIDRENVFEYYEPVIPDDGTQTPIIPETSVNGDSAVPSRLPSLAPESVEDSNSQPPVSNEGSISTPSIEPPTQADIGLAPVTSQKYPFPKVQDVEIFEDYLGNPSSLEYDELYGRLAKVSDCLIEWQQEFTEMDKEILAHETQQKAEKARLEEEAKIEAEAARILDDEAREKIRDEYKSKLSLKGQEWTDFIQDFDSSEPEQAEILRHFSNLRNPQFMAQVNKKRTRPVRAVKKTVRFENEPLPEVKSTKEEMAKEKRKRGKLVDPIRFDDMKQADVYGVEYSSHNKHLGAQPLGSDKSRSSQKKKVQVANGNDATASDVEGASSSRTRAPRTTVRRYDDGDIEDTPDPEEEEQLPAKRKRKPTKLVEDGSESVGVSRSQSRGDTPVKTFKSGKRIGRPPTKNKSNLQAVEMAPASPTPDLAGASTHRNNPQELAPSQQAELEQAAESLVNQTVSDKAEAAPIKKKHAGGRPRKNPLVPKTGKAAEPIVAGDPMAKPKNKGGRPKKSASHEVKLEPESHDSAVKLGFEHGILQSTEGRDSIQEPGSSAGSARPKRKRTTIEVEENNLGVNSTPAKKRKIRVVSRSESQATSVAQSPGVSKGTSTAPSQLGGSASEEESKPKRKRATKSSTASKAVSVAASETGDDDTDSKKRKAFTTASGRPAKKAKTAKPADIDYGVATAEEIKEYEKRLAAYKKSQKLSESLRNRWASGGMKQAQATRLANNQLKRQQKEAEASASGSVAPVATDPTAPAVAAALVTESAPAFEGVEEALQEFKQARKSKILKLPLSGAKSSSSRAPAKSAAATTPKLNIAAVKKIAPKRVKSTSAAAPVPAPARSGRGRKPKSFGLDGADDDSDDEEVGISEYDRFQAIMSPDGEHGLPKKRERKMMRESLAFESEEDTHGAETTDNDGDEYSI